MRGSQIVAILLPAALACAAGTAAVGAPAAPLQDRAIDLAAGGAIVIMGSPDNDQLGNDLAVGDVNADGMPDLAIGAHWSGGAGRNIVGRTYVLFGRRAWPATIDLYGRGAADWSFRGGGREARLGASVTVADLGGDRTDDLAMGAVLDDPGGQIDAGAVHVAFGGAGVGGDVDLADTHADVLLAGASRTGDQLGTDLVTADFNGDGRRDIAVAAGNRERGVGAVFVWWGPFAHGDTHRLDEAEADWTILGPAAQSWFGSALAAGDVDGDGVDDLVVAAARGTVDPATPDGGAVLVFHGGPRVGGVIDLGRDTPDTTVIGPPAAMIGLARSTLCACRGRPLAVADITGDARLDLVIGAPLDAGRRGRVWVLRGPVPAGTVVLPNGALELAGSVADGRLGWAVAVHDIDGDGLPDLVAAAPFAAAGARAKAGRIYALRGPLAAAADPDVERRAALVVLGPSASAGNAGIAVALADLDADGAVDLAAGFPDAAPAGRNASGSVYLLRGPLLLPAPTSTAGTPSAAPPTATHTAGTPSATPPPATHTAAPDTPTASATLASPPAATSSPPHPATEATPVPTAATPRATQELVLPMALRGS